MEAYPTVSLRDVCESVEYGFTASATKDSVGPRFLRITDIVPEQLDWEGVPFCKIESKKLAKYLLRTGDIVIARTGATTGWAKFIKNPPDAIFASYLIRIRPAPTVDPRFIGFVVESSVYKEFIQQHMGGAAQPNANAQILTSYKIPLPPLPEQKRIAGILSAYDELIENSQRRIKVLETMARNLYREWFVHYRYPGHENIPLTPSTLGDIPKGWEVKSIQQFGTVITGKTPSKANEDFFGNDVPFVKTPDMHGNMFVLGTNDCLSTVGADSQANKTLPPGSICVSCIGTIGVVSITTEYCQTNQQINSVVLVHPTSREFLYLRLQDSKQMLENLGANGATMGNVNKGKFEALEIVCPSDELLASYHRLVEPMFSEILSLSRQIQNLRKTRDLLLPRLLSGQIAINTPATQAA